ncbi:MAG: hypothetical protein Q4G69_10490 [Planctomycetia bacterium]|nr:hypothetical protein [Planctomycetia bacterium]
MRHSILPSYFLILCLFFLNLDLINGQDPAPAPEGAPPAEGAPAADGPAPPPAIGAGTKEVQALVYPDTKFLIRIDTKRIDFDGTSEFIGDFIHGAIGSVVSNDKYLVRLREQQKTDLKNGFTNYFTKLQTDWEKNLWANGISQFFYIHYEEGADYCTCLAYPIEGLDDAKKESLVAMAGANPKTITCFERFGFMIVVIGHSGGEIDEKLEAAKKKDEKKEEEEEEEEEVAVDPFKVKRAATLPEIRRRFMKMSALKVPNVSEALAATDGVAITLVLKDTAALSDMIALCKANGFDIPDTGIQKTLEVNKKKFKWSVGAISMVGTPRMVLLTRFSDGAAAAELSAAIKEALGGMRAGIDSVIDTQLTELKDMGIPFVTNPFNAMLGLLFNGAKTESKGTDSALVYDLDILRRNATTFVPIFGGVPSKIEKKKKLGPDGEEMIDFGDEEEAPKDGAKPAPKKKEVDPFG